MYNHFLITSAILILSLLGWSGMATPQAQPPGLWIDNLSPEIQSCILWSADHEAGNLQEWHRGAEGDAGGGIFNTGGAEVEAVVSNLQSHSGQYAAKATITNAIRAENGARAVRFMRWTDRPWSEGGLFFPAEAYYSVWMYFPRVYDPEKSPPWDPGDGGWWNIFQFKVPDAENDSQPMWILNVRYSDSRDTMELYLFSPENNPPTYRQDEPKPLPAQQWVHVEVFYRYQPGDNAGMLAVWQDGELILNVQDVKTVLEAKAGPTWGLGNYTDHIVGDEVDGSATIFFDDAVVSRRRVSSDFPVMGCSELTRHETLPPILPVKAPTPEDEK